MKDWKYLDNFSAEEILRKYFSEQIWQKIWKPLLKMKFGDDFYRVSATWIWDRISTRSRSQKIGRKSKKA